MTKIIIFLSSSYIFFLLIRDCFLIQHLRSETFQFHSNKIILRTNTELFFTIDYEDGWLKIQMKKWRNLRYFCAGFRTNLYMWPCTASLLLSMRAQESLFKGDSHSQLKLITSKAFLPENLIHFNQTPSTWNKAKLWSTKCFGLSLRWAVRRRGRNLTHSVTYFTFVVVK